jgi:hypothetical protein
MAVAYYPSEFKNWPPAQYWIVTAVTAMTMGLSQELANKEKQSQAVSKQRQGDFWPLCTFAFGGGVFKFS